MSQHNKRVGYEGENLVSDHYKQQGHTLLISNYTIRGGEIDLIFLKNDYIRFVEVKVVNHIDELHGYVTKKKLYYLEKTIQHFFRDHRWKQYVSCEWSLDVVFVKMNSIYEIYSDVYL